MKLFQWKKIILSFIIGVGCMSFLPFAFSLNTEHASSISDVELHNKKLSESFANNTLSFVYDSMQLEAKGLSQEAFDDAVKGYTVLKDEGKLANEDIISIADFSKPSNKKRLFVIDLKNLKLLFNTYVAHGQNSGREMAEDFSNTPESFQSSLGFYITSGTYMGKNGFSMKLKGLENGINNKAMERAIVMHGAPYVSEDFIRSNGYLGRSWGCPAVPQALNKPIINAIKNGSCLFIFGNSNGYFKRSKFINS